MREIKFRGRNDKHGWLTGHYFVNRGVHFIVEDGIANPLNTWEDYAVDPDTVGQYTGLKDKDGKEIYEGDIVKDKYENRYEVRYDDKRMSWIAHSTIPFENNLPLCVVTECTIIDNIHDNPELLEDGK